MLVLELAPHGSLTSAMATGLIQGRQLKHRILLQIALGLQVLHEHKIVYMDLKPDNVLIFSLAVGEYVDISLWTGHSKTVTWVLDEPGPAQVGSRPSFEKPSFLNMQRTLFLNF